MSAGVEALMEAQLVEMRELNMLSRRLEDAASGEVDLVLELLMARAGLLESLGERGARIAGEGSESERAARLRAILIGLGEEIHERDERTLAALMERRDDARGELGGIGRSREAVRAYGGRMSAGARFRDDRA